MRRALVDAQDAAVSIEPLDLALAHVAVAAVDLQRPVDAGEAVLSRDVFSDRRVAPKVDALVLERRRAVGRQPSRLDGHVHLGEQQLNRLEVANRPAELAPLRCVVGRELERAHGDSVRHRGDVDAGPVEDLFGLEGMGGIGGDAGGKAHEGVSLADEGGAEALGRPFLSVLRSHNSAGAVKAQERLDR